MHYFLEFGELWDQTFLNKKNSQPVTIVFKKKKKLIFCQTWASKEIESQYYYFDEEQYEM